MPATVSPIIELCLEDDNWRGVEELESKMVACVSAALKQANQGDEIASLTIVLADNQRVEALNNDWRDKQKPTNILSFPAPAHSLNDEGHAYLGDLILAYGVIFDEAGTQTKPFVTHLCHLVVHGVLHLLGYDHQNDEEADYMEQLEIKAMAALGLPDPYQTTNI